MTLIHGNGKALGKVVALLDGGIEGKRDGDIEKGSATRDNNVDRVTGAVFPLILIDAVNGANAVQTRSSFFGSHFFHLYFFLNLKHGKGGN